MKIVYRNSQRLEGCDILLVGVEVKNTEEYVKNLVKSIIDTSWISDLDEVAQISYKANSTKTVKKIVDIFNSHEGDVKGDIGEYIVSLSAVDVLCMTYSHHKIPLSELWKSKLIGNDGFDFHTVTPISKINFGEAKYNYISNPYTVAAKQVIRFIEEEKDDSDLIHIQSLEPHIGVKPDYEKKSFNYSISFSVNSEDVKSIIENSLESEDVKNLAKRSKQLFVIGVKIVSV